MLLLAVTLITSCFPVTFVLCVCVCICRDDLAQLVLNNHPGATKLLERFGSLMHERANQLRDRCVLRVSAPLDLVLDSPSVLYEDAWHLAVFGFELPSGLYEN